MNDNMLIENLTTCPSCISFSTLTFTTDTVAFTYLSWYTIYINCLTVALENCVAFYIKKYAVDVPRKW